MSEFEVLTNRYCIHLLIEWAPKKRHNPQALQPMASQEYGNILDLHFQALDRKFFG